MQVPTAKLVLKLGSPRRQIPATGRAMHTMEADGMRQYRRSVQAVFRTVRLANPRMGRRDHRRTIVTKEKIDKRQARDGCASSSTWWGWRSGFVAHLFPHSSRGANAAIAIARALALSPKLVVPDERAALTSRSAPSINCWSTQRDLGLPIFIAHDLAAVAHMSHTIASCTWPVVEYARQDRRQ